MKRIYSDYTCAICDEEYAYVIPNPINRGELLICKSHYEFLESVKNSILTQLIQAGN